MGAAGEPLGTGQGFVGGYAAQTPVSLPDGPLTRDFYAVNARLWGIRFPYGGHGYRGFIDATADSLAQRMGARLRMSIPTPVIFKASALASLAVLALQASGCNQSA
ncbi:MAG: hypothetical protein IPN92_20755 [Chromatiaceae bacterium]|nr:hypothetical protein [Chromatiaceae bacterium]